MIKKVIIGLLIGSFISVGAIKCGGGHVYSQDLGTSREVSNEEGRPIYNDKHSAILVSTLDDMVFGDIMYLHINSYGGDASEMLVIINHMKSCKGRVIVVLEGVAASAAAMIASQAKELIVQPETVLLFHSARIISKDGEIKFTSPLQSYWDNVSLRTLCMLLTSDEMMSMIVFRKDITLDGFTFKNRMKRLGVIIHEVSEMPIK